MDERTKNGERILRRLETVRKEAEEIDKELGRLDRRGKVLKIVQTLLIIVAISILLFSAGLAIEHFKNQKNTSGSQSDSPLTTKKARTWSSGQRRSITLKL